MLVCGWIVLVDLLLISWAIRRPTDWVKFALIFLVAASLPALIYIGYRTWSVFSLEYWVDRNALTIRWANARQIIPMPAISRVIQQGIPDLGRPGFIHWPGTHVRPARALGLLNITMLSTRPLPECILVETEEGVFALSPRDPEEFLAALQERYRLGPSRAEILALARTQYVRRLFGQDRTGPVLVGIGLLGALTLIGLFMANFPDLPDALAVDYNNDGIPDMVRDKSALFLLPAMGFLAWLINGTWGIWMSAHEQQTGAYMLWGGAIIVQVCSLLALASLLA